MKRNFLICFCLLFVLSLNAFGEDHSANTKEEDIRKLLIMSGSADMAVEVVNQLIGQFKTIFPDIPEEYWDEVRKEINAEQLVEQIVPVYDKHFTHKEILDIIAFYETPTGKKMIKETPAITQESINIGQVWGMEIAQRVQKKLQEDGMMR